MLVFVDESGDCGMKKDAGSSPYFIVTAVLFEDNEEAEACDKRIAECRQALKVRDSFEFKFYSCSDAFRECFFHAVAGCNFFYHSIVINKSGLYGPGFQEKNSFYKYATSLVFQNAKPNLREATIVLDKFGNREFGEQLSKYLKKKLNTDGVQFIKKIRMETSHSNALLQLADMVCGAVGRSLNQKAKDGMRFRRLVGHRELRVQIWPK
jgi:hypothetical protein